MDAPAPGGLGGTYAGNPLACAAGLAVLDVFDQEHVLEQGQRLGNRLRAHLEGLQVRYPQIGDVRGLGAMLAIELVRDRETKEPAADLVDRMVVAAREAGLLLLKAGLYGNVVRILVPLTIEDALLDKGLAIFDAALAKALG
jgi:4-aminobutyrate aminotransferase/(S)-3-amino-2-methylpropionate transaminase